MNQQSKDLPFPESSVVCRIQTSLKIECLTEVGRDIKSAPEAEKFGSDFSKKICE